MSDVWEDVMAEVAATEAWLAMTWGERPSVNIYVGWHSLGKWYAGMAVDGETGEEPYQQEADTPEEALRLFLIESREYRARIDAEHEDDQIQAVLDTVAADPSVMERPR